MTKKKILDCAMIAFIATGGLGVWQASGMVERSIGESVHASNHYVYRLLGPLRIELTRNGISDTCVLLSSEHAKTKCPPGIILAIKRSDWHWIASRAVSKEADQAMEMAKGPR